MDDLFNNGRIPQDTTHEADTAADNVEETAENIAETASEEITEAVPSEVTEPAAETASEEVPGDALSEETEPAAEIASEEVPGGELPEETEPVAESSSEAITEAAPAEEAESTAAADTSDSNVHAGNDDAASKNTTYSWVNPKLQGGSGQGQTANNPWNSQNGGNYWQYNSNADGRQQAAGQQNQNNGYQNHTAGQQNQNNGYQNHTAGTNSNTGYQHNAAGTNSGYQNHTAGSGQNTGSYSNASGAQQNRGWAQQNQSAERKSRKAMDRGNGSAAKSTAGKWASLIAMALVFGLVAGLMMYSVNFVANRIRPASSNTAASTPQIEETKTGNTQTETADTDESSAAASDSSSNQTADGTMSVASVAKEAMPSLVTISTMSVQEMQSFFGGTQQYTVEGAGTGVIIGQNDEELLIATNNHVVEGATQVSVGFIDESVISANIKGMDPDTDLAIVAVNFSDIPSETQSEIKIASVGDSDALVLGEQVVAIGNALGYGQSVTSGYVSGLNRTLQFSDSSGTFTSDGLIQTDAAINSGNSGGALLNMRGELIGINEAKSSSTSSGTSVDNVGYAIPMSKAMPILEELMNEETRAIVSADEQGYLGVTCADVTSEYSQVYNMPEGVCFTSVVENGPAAQAGALKGDVLTKFAGKTITSFSALENALRYYKAGETVEITVMRANNGTYVENILTVTLGTKEVISSIQQNAGQDNTQQDANVPQENTAPESENNAGNENRENNTAPDEEEIPRTLTPQEDDGDLFGQLFGSRD